jgi:hypothetical protein
MKEIKTKLDELKGKLTEAHSEYKSKVDDVLMQMVSLVGEMMMLIILTLSSKQLMKQAMEVLR